MKSGNMRTLATQLRRLLGKLAALIAAAVSLSATPGAAAGTNSLLDQFRAGPMAGVQEVIFAARKLNETDGHWYANLGYYAHDPNRKAWREGTKLYRWNLATGKLTTLLDDPRGGVRDPQVHYDGGKILFSYRKGGTEQYHLYEMNADGTGLRPLTDGLYDDIEPTYLPNGDIVFVSSRCKRWVNCWLTQVATLYRCDANGHNIRPISSNNEQDNTPWPLPDGRLLYTRWEYVDRSQVHYHHLWVANPDGTAQMTWYGNLHPGIVMIDAKPIPGSDKVVASFSPDHGLREHAGRISIVDPTAGPDAQSFARPVSRGNQFRDPWAFSEDCFMAALGPALVVMDKTGAQKEIFKLPEADIRADLQLHEPRPLMPRPRERIIPDRVDPRAATGRLVLADIYNGRNMAGVKRGEIKKLLVLETLPMPIHYTGGMEPISYGGTFTLERLVGTVPVEEDGSAYFELPALRSFFFVALDENDLSVKRMQSFLTVQPGETTSCIGCHEQRTQAPRSAATQLAAVRRAPSPIQPIADVPEVIDYPRDIQPILDALCVSCHGYDKTSAGGPRAGRLILTGDHGPLYSHSYYMLTIAGLISDGRNLPRSNYAPRTLGSSASRLLKLVDRPNHGVKATPLQKKMLRLWIDSGAAYPGTYAALGCGMIGDYAENQEIHDGQDWPTTQAAAKVIQKRCIACHTEPARLLPQSLADERGVSFWQPSLDDPRLLTSRHIVFNLSRPEKSLILLAPLAESAGGWGLCRDPKTHERVTVFADKTDPGYQDLLALCVAGKESLAKGTRRFDMPDFRPRADWVREMKRYGILPADLDPAAPVDCYATEQKYWQSLWYSPASASP
jgi:mono/diheme cytochrome c family protein